MVNITICSLLYFYVFSSVIMKLILAVLVLFWWSRPRHNGTSTQDKPLEVTYFPFNLHLLLSHALSWVGSQADFNHFTVFCRCKGHVACLPGYEAGQLERLRQVFPCTWELWCCKKGPRRQMGSRSDQVCQIWHDFIP